MEGGDEGGVWSAADAPAVGQGFAEGLHSHKSS
jgi:hypothetical protein